MMDREVSGLDAIDQEFERIYPDQKNPKHYATMVKWKFGGPDPLDEVSVFDGGDFWHFVTYGFSELHDKEFENKEISGYGFEMTFKLKKGKFPDLEAELRNIVMILQALARVVFLCGEVYRPLQSLGFEHGVGIDARHVSKLTGFIVINDPSVHTLDTKNGRVEFLELIGVTDEELDQVSDDQSVLDLYGKLGTDVTDYSRDSVA